MPTSRLHTLADIATRTVAVLTVGGLAGLAGTVSYRHMVLLAQRNGQHGIDAHAFPLCVDGLDLIGVLVLLADRRAGRPSGWLPWTVLALGTVASVAANVAVAPDNAVARAISGWSAVALLAAAKMLAHLFEPATPARRQTADEAAAAPEAIPGRTAAPPRPDPKPVTSPGGDNVPVRGHRTRRRGDPTRRVPTTPDAYARWCAIWGATRHIPSATGDLANAHQVSLRTLQFIRAAGRAGQLTSRPRPASSVRTAQRGASFRARPTEPDPAESGPRRVFSGDSD